MESAITALRDDFYQLDIKDSSFNELKDTWTKTISRMALLSERYERFDNENNEKRIFFKKKLDELDMLLAKKRISQSLYDQGVKETNELIASLDARKF